MEKLKLDHMAYAQVTYVVHLKTILSYELNRFPTLVMLAIYMQNQAVTVGTK